MDTQKVTTQYRLSQWAKVIQARQESGQNIKDFCLKKSAVCWGHCDEME